MGSQCNWFWWRDTGTMDCILESPGTTDDDIDNDGDD